jgi:hypothetical protein
MYLTGDTAEAAGTAGPASGPSAGLYLTEPARGLAGLAFLPLAAPWLATAPTSAVSQYLTFQEPVTQRYCSAFPQAGSGTVL